MALSDDQRALLRLLAKREEGYEDIAALKGLSVEQVRAEVKDALADLEAADEAPPQPPAAAPAESAPSPPAPEKTPEAVEAPTPTAAPAKREQSARKPRPGLPVERRRLLLLTGGALGAVAIVLALIALIGGGSGSDSDTAKTDSTTAAVAAESDKVTQAVLTAADGSDASGSAIFGRVGKEEIVLQVTAENLEPTEPGQSYTVWLYRSPKLSLRVGSAPVSDEGRLGAQFPIPAELLAYIAGGAFNQVYISRLDNAAYKQEVVRAKQSKSLPRYSGETVLTGEITGPIAKAAAQAEGG